jgi:molybdate transport system substrate-binding protein
MASPSPISAGSELTVFAAASLKDAFEQIEAPFEAAHPGVKVTFNFGGSQQLAAQINQGALADVFASAAAKNLDQVAYDPSSRRIFALNQLVVITRSSSGRLHSLRALSNCSRIVLAAPPVPAGGYALYALRAVSKRLGQSWLNTVQQHVVSQEQDVRAVLAKVELGEADAGIVYRSDAVSGKGKVYTLAIPDAYQPAIVYPIAGLKSSTQPHLCMEFIHFVLGPEGQRVLSGQGFVSPLARAGSVQLDELGRKRKLNLGLLESGPAKTVTVTDESGASHKYAGRPIQSLISSAKVHEVRFSAADGYSQTFPFEALKAAHAILIVTPESKLQVIVPGEKPRRWVKWITEIVAR